jgi:hypothetical protein
MKFSIFFLVSILSLSAQARSYGCFGLDNQDLVKVVELTDIKQSLGTFKGAEVEALEDDGLISVGIKQGDVLTTISTKDVLSFRQRVNGVSAGFSCMLAK